MLGFFRTSHRPASRRGAKDAQTLADELEARIDSAIRERLVGMGQLVAALPAGWEYQSHHAFAFITHAARLRAGIRRARHEPTHASTPPSELLYFCISTAFLRYECFPFLTGDELRREVLHLVTGPITPQGVRVPSRIEKVTMHAQSAGYAAADPLNTHKQLVDLERDGHSLLCCFHSHISHGLDSTRPSQTDLTTQDRFAAIGWQAIGGIFSLDGFVRLFSTGDDFVVELYGNGAQIVSATRRETIIKLAIER